MTWFLLHQCPFYEVDYCFEHRVRIYIAYYACNLYIPYERMNGEIRDRERVMRGLEKKDTPILTGYQLFHNYIRPHMALENRTPAEAAGIKVEGKNKWMTLIQNASREKKAP